MRNIYDKDLNIFFRNKLAHDSLLSQVGRMKKSLQSGGGSFNTTLERKLQSSFEIDDEHYTMTVGGSSKQIKRKPKMLRQDIDEYIDIVQRSNYKKLLIKKYNILYEISDISKDVSELEKHRSLEAYIEDIKKLKASLSDIDEKERMTSLQESESFSLTLEGIKEELKTETDPEIRKDLFEKYADILNEKYEAHVESIDNSVFHELDMRVLMKTSKGSSNSDIHKTIYRQSVVNSNGIADDESEETDAEIHTDQIVDLDEIQLEDANHNNAQAQDQGNNQQSDMMQKIENLGQSFSNTMTSVYDQLTSSSKKPYDNNANEHEDTIEDVTDTFGN